MTEGFCYVADRAGYIEEALASATSLKVHMPNAQVALVCPTRLFPVGTAFDYHVPLGKEHSGLIARADAVNAPFDRVMLLDSDTLIAGDLTDAFRILERFDLAAAHEPTRGWDYPCDAPPAFCELNMGVVLFSNNARIRRMFERWAQNYYAMRDKYGLVNDQPAFRATLWEATDVRIATLPSEFHCIVGKPLSIAWEARLLHGRGDLVSMEREINRRVGNRVFAPGWGQLRGFAGRRFLVGEYWRLTLNFLKTLLLPSRRADPAEKVPVKWWK